ncbi:methanogenesis marker 5 protein [Methanobacterium formicicum]|nr:methanogenesis marker 5 protein [Methanobacterium formicicum]
MVERKGHEPLVIQKEIRKKVTDPEIDSPPFNITEEEPIKGLKYAAIEVPSGVRGRMAIFGPIIDEAEAAIIMEDAPYGFGCIGCARTNELSMYFLRKRGIPVLEIHYPESKDETVEVINKINTFLDGLDKSESDEKAEPEKDTKETVEE